MPDYSPSKRLLLTAASAVEFRSLLAGLCMSESQVPELWQTVNFSDAIVLLHTGVGKANAAGAVAKTLNSGITYGGVLSLGLAGSYDPQIPLGTSVVGLSHWMPDEGTITKKPPGWLSLEDAGWMKSSVECDHGELHGLCRALAEHACDVATISTISGTNELRDQYLKRAPVKIETMESCAIANACLMHKVEYADLRVVSNFCGERTTNNHDFPGALKALAKLTERVLEALEA